MSMYLGERAYATWRDRMLERNLPTSEFKELAYWRQEAWQSVGEELARVCGVDPVVFKDAPRQGQ